MFTTLHPDHLYRFSITSRVKTAPKREVRHHRCGVSGGRRESYGMAHPAAKAKGVGVVVERKSNRITCWGQKVSAMYLAANAVKLTEWRFGLFGWCILRSR